MVKLIITLLFLLLPFNTLAATIPSNGTVSDVQAKVNSAVSGDVITIPAGTFTWASEVNIPDSKQLIIQGAGPTTTTINRNGRAFALNESASKISDIGFALSDGDGLIHAQGIRWWIDNCKFNNTSGLAKSAIVVDSYARDVKPYGLISNSEFINFRVLSNTYDTLSDQSNVWSSNLVLGSYNQIFIEDNTFTKTDGSAGWPVIIASRASGLTVRYNQITGNFISAYGLNSNELRGVRSYEIYNNSFTAVNTTERLLLLTGGTGVIFNNSLTNSLSVSEVGIETRRANNSYTPYGLCNGSSPYDGNLDSTGWPCRDQVGVGRDVVVGRYIRLVALSEVNSQPWTAVAEINVVGKLPGGTTSSLISQAGWSLAYVDSEETVGEDGRAINAFDGNNNTFWHTEWYSSNPPHPHEIQIDLGAIYELDSFSYLPRQDGDDNGHIINYEFYVSSDGINWGSSVASGSFTSSLTLKTVTFQSSSSSMLSQERVPLYLLNNGFWDVDVITSPSHHTQIDRDYYTEAGIFTGVEGTGYGLLSARPATCTQGVAYLATNENIIYKCTSTNVWEEYYTPPDYPHYFNTIHSKYVTFDPSADSRTIGHKLYFSTNPNFTENVYSVDLRDSLVYRIRNLDNWSNYYIAAAAYGYVVQDGVVTLRESEKSPIYLHYYEP